MPEFVTSDGVRLHYLDDGAGPPIVLIAGFRAPASSWVFQRRHLLGRGHRVLALDRRGHGRSDSPTWGHRLARHGRDLAEFLSAVALPRETLPVLVGGSMGASTIWAYLDQGHDAAAVRGIVAVDQTPKMTNEHGWVHGFYGYGAHNLGTLFANGAPPTGHGTPPADRGARATRMAEAFAGSVPAPLTATDLALLRDHAVQDWRDVLARTSIPTLHVAGRDSELWPCEHAAACAELNPLAQAVIVEGCGHVVNAEQPHEFNGHLDDFIDALG